MTVALQHLATAHPHSPHKLEICGAPLMGSNPAIYKKIKDLPNGKSFVFVAKLGFEPRQTEPESVVLPLHHLAIPKGN